MKILCIAALTVVFSAQEAFTQSNSTSRLEEKRAPISTRAEDQFFSFELHECVKSGTTVECSLTVTNKGDDRRFNIWNRQTYLYDDSGNNYRSTKLKLADKENPGTITFVADVSAVVRLTFSGVATAASKAALIEIGFGSGVSYPKSTSIKFRNVPFVLASEKETDDTENQDENRTSDGLFANNNAQRSRCDVPPKKGVVYIVVKYKEYRKSNAILGRTFVIIKWGPNKFDRKFPSFISMTPSRGVVIAARHNSNSSVPLFIETNGTLESCRQLDRPPSLHFYEKASW
jgi:hypothetical protein